jgi:excisionase family DNA binding protein
MDGKRELVTVAEAAAELGMSVRGLLKRLERGDMSGERVNPRLWLIPISEVERWKQLGRQKPGPKPRQPEQPPSDDRVTVACRDCGHQLDAGVIASSDADMPCPECGSTARMVRHRIRRELNLRGGVRYKGRSKEGGRPWIKGRSEPDLWRDTGIMVERQLQVNRRDDRYTERVTDPATGEVIHETDELLSAHQGHGSARRAASKNPRRAATEGADAPVAMRLVDQPPA